MSSPQLSFTTLHSTDHLLSSPHHHPDPQPKTTIARTAPTHPTHLFTHPCSVPSCSEQTTSPPLPVAFLPLAVLCFPAGSESKSAFASTSVCYLCRVHRTTLQRFRQRVVTHAEDSSQQWTDDPHSSPLKAEDMDDADEQQQQSMHEPTAHSALIPASSAIPMRYSTFTDAAVAMDVAGEAPGEKRPLSLAARSALAGGWLLVVSFVALTCAWGIVARLRT